MEENENIIMVYSFYLTIDYILYPEGPNECIGEKIFRRTISRGRRRWNVEIRLSECWKRLADCGVNFVYNVLLVLHWVGPHLPSHHIWIGSLIGTYHLYYNNLK